MVNLPLSPEDENRRLKLQQSLDTLVENTRTLLQRTIILPCRHKNIILIETNVQWCDKCGAYRRKEGEEWDDGWILPK